MINSLDWDSIIDLKSMEYAENKKFWSKALFGMIQTYKNSYNKFVTSHHKSINKFLDENSANNNEFSENMKLVKLLIFLRNGKKLINEKNNLDEKKFNNYVAIEDKNELKEWNKNWDLAEEKWKGIKKVNSELQFIISFNDNPLMRKKYFEKVLLEIKKENEATRQDYRKKNIFESLFQTFNLTIDQHNYSH